MKKVITLCIGMLTLTASLAMATAGGVNLNVNDALGCSSLTNTVSNPCTANTGSFILVGSVIAPRDLVQFGASGVILDIQTTDSGQINDWLRLDACRNGKASTLFDVTVASCGTIWDTNPGAAPLGIAQWQFGINGTNRIRLNAGAAVATPYDFAASTGEVGVFKLTISKQLSTGTGACTGCAIPACIVLNEISLQEVGVLPYVTVTNAASNNFIVYNSTLGGLATCPTNTPTRNRTWGAVKAMYR